MFDFDDLGPLKMKAICVRPEKRMIFRGELSASEKIVLTSVAAGGGKNASSCIFSGDNWTRFRDWFADADVLLVDVDSGQPRALDVIRAVSDAIPSEARVQVLGQVSLPDDYEPPAFDRLLETVANVSSYSDAVIVSRNVDVARSLLRNLFLCEGSGTEVFDIMQAIRCRNGWFLVSGSGLGENRVDTIRYRLNFQFNEARSLTLDGSLVIVFIQGGIFHEELLDLYSFIESVFCSAEQTLFRLAPSDNPADPLTVTILVGIDLDVSSPVGHLGRLLSEQSIRLWLSDDNRCTRETRKGPCEGVFSHFDFLGNANHCKPSVC